MQLPYKPAFSSSRPRSSAASATFRASSGAGSWCGIADELERQHRAETPDVADLRKRSCQPAHACSDRLADLGCAVDEPFLLDHVEDGERGGLRDPD